MNMKSGSQRSEKCCWYQLVDEFMYDRASVVSHAHASVVNPDGLKCTGTSDTTPRNNGVERAHQNLPNLSIRKIFFLNVVMVR